MKREQKKEKDGAKQPGNDNSALTRRYEEHERRGDDLRELFESVGRYADTIDDAIKEAGFFRILFLSIKGARDLTQKGYRFTIEWNPDTRLWTVGYRAVRRSEQRPDVIVEDAKLDTAVTLLMQAWEQWAEEAKKVVARRGKSKRS